MVMPHLGPLEIGLIVLLVLIIFGVGRLPQVGSALGKSIREFRKGRSGEFDDKPEEEELEKPEVKKVETVELEKPKEKKVKTK